MTINTSIDRAVYSHLNNRDNTKDGAAKTLHDGSSVLSGYIAMRALLVILAMLSLANHLCGSDADRKPADQESLRSYMTGDYDLIGRKSDSTTIYNGRVTIREENERLKVTRTVEGKTDTSIARFDTVAGTDRIPVLRMHFHFDGKDYEAIYIWQSDPDNYPRLTGYLYLAGTKSPGLEALFPIHK